MSVRLVLDTSALLAYVGGDTRAIEIGELIANVEESGDITGVPAVCLVEAYRQVKGDQRVNLLELTADDEGPTVILPMLVGDVGSVAELGTVLPIDLAHAVSAAAKHDALLGTYQRAAYGTTVDEDEILDL